MEREDIDIVICYADIHLLHPQPWHIGRCRWKLSHQRFALGSYAGEDEYGEIG